MENQVETPAEPTPYTVTLTDDTLLVVSTYRRFSQVIGTYTDGYGDAMTLTYSDEHGYADNFVSGHYSKNTVTLKQGQLDEGYHVTTSEHFTDYLNSNKFGTLQECVSVAADLPDYELRRCRSTFNHMYIKAIGNGVSKAVITMANALFRPQSAEPGFVSIFRTAKDSARDRRTTLKVGRALRHMFPEMCHNTLSAIAEDYIERTSPRDFTLVVSKEADDFAKAYDNPLVDFRNPDITYSRKSLATSCMQGTRVYLDDGGTSVAVCYATGDFSIAYLVDADDEIAGRVVIGHKTETVDGDDVVKHYHAPIYGCCEQSIDMIQEYLDKIGAESDQGGWRGLRMAYIEDSSGDVCGPYLDGSYGGDQRGDYITLSVCRGEYTFDTTCGNIGGGICCEGCGERVNEDYIYHDDDGYCYCEHCFFERYSLTDDGETYPVDEVVEAFHMPIRSSYGTTYKTSSHVHIDEAVYIERLEEFWVAGAVTYVDEIDDYYPKHLLAELEELNVNNDDEDET